MKKILLLSVFAVTAFYLGQAMACTNTGGDRHVNSTVAKSSSPTTTSTTQKDR